MLVMLTIFFISLFIMVSDKILFLMLFLFLYASFISVLFIFMGIPWFGLLFFLIYVSGLLILFGYTMAMSPNTFSPPISKKYLGLVLILPILPELYKMNTEVVKVTYFHDIVDIFSFSNLTMYLIMTIMLFLSLLAVVNITYKSPSPLRPYL